MRGSIFIYHDKSSQKEGLFTIENTQNGYYYPQNGYSNSLHRPRASAFFASAIKSPEPFFGHPDERYHLTEVIKLIGSGRGAVQRELEKLTNAGILNLLAVGSRKIYQANKESPIFDDLYQLILKTVGLLEPLRNALKRHISKIDVAFVYGSVAKGKETTKSDIDLMILGHDLAYGEIYSALQKTEKLLRRTINPNLMTLSEWNEKYSDKSAFVTKVSNQPKLFIFGEEDDLKRTR